MKSALTGNIILEKAKKSDVKDIVELIYITEPKPEMEWGFDSDEERKEILKKLVEIQDNRFSLNNILIARKNSKLVGMALLIEGKDMDRLTINSRKQIRNKQKKLFNKLGYMYNEIKSYFFYEECKEDEFYISNIAVKKEYRGNGYAKMMIHQIYKLARKKGYKKVSLIAKNDSLIHFYESVGFHVINRKLRRMIIDV